MQASGVSRQQHWRVAGQSCCHYAIKLDHSLVERHLKFSPALESSNQHHLMKAAAFFLPAR